MESIEKGKDALLSGIETDIRAEEQQIIKNAQEQAAQKRKYGDKQIESILEDARKQAQELAEVEKQKVLASVHLEIKRRSLHVRDEVIHRIMELVEKKLYSMIDNTEYKSVLTDLITEAAIGLDTDSASINASEKERALIDEQLISQVREKIHDYTDRRMDLKLCDSPPLKNQGVVLTSADGHVAFNNQIKIRISRNQRKIRTLIYDTLFSDNREE